MTIELEELLEEVQTTGLVYWEPASTVGHTNKARLLARVEAAAVLLRSQRQVDRWCLYLIAGMLAFTIFVGVAARWPEWTYLLAASVVGFCIGRGSGYA